MARGRHFSLSLPAWRQVCEPWLQKRSPSWNLGEHLSVRRSGTTSRGTSFLIYIFCACIDFLLLKFLPHSWEKNPFRVKWIQSNYRLCQVLQRVDTISVCWWELVWGQEEQTRKMTFMFIPAILKSQYTRENHPDVFCLRLRSWLQLRLRCLSRWCELEINVGEWGVKRFHLSRKINGFLKLKLTN